VWTSNTLHHYFKEPIFKVFERLGKHILSIYSWSNYKRQPGIWTSRPRIKEIKKRPRRRLQVQRHTQHPECLQIRPVVRMQLSRSDVQQPQCPHGRLIKRQPHMQLRKMTHIHIKELLNSSLSVVPVTFDNTNPLRCHNVPSSALLKNGSTIQPQI